LYDCHRWQVNNFNIYVNRLHVDSSNTCQRLTVPISVDGDYRSTIFKIKNICQLFTSWQFQYQWTVDSSNICQRGCQVENYKISSILLKLFIHFVCQYNYLSTSHVDTNTCSFKFLVVRRTLIFTFHNHLMNFFKEMTVTVTVMLSIFRIRNTKLKKTGD
jgi:hypothetical protein